MARGRHDLAAPDELELVDCMITNAVRCVPPANKPTPSEIAHCRQFLIGRIAALPNLRTLLALGRIAHDATLDALELKKRDFPFAHGARHELPSGLVLFDSYHCSRQNTNTGRLTTDNVRGGHARGEPRQVRSLTCLAAVRQVGHALGSVIPSRS